MVELLSLFYHCIKELIYMYFCVEPRMSWEIPAVIFKTVSGLERAGTSFGHFDCVGEES